jgi:hypothetical protein
MTPVSLTTSNTTTLQRESPPSPRAHPFNPLTPEQASQLQTWLPPGGSSSPMACVELYRGTTHGFSASSFHARCDGRARLLVLVQAEGDWLFGGFTAVGFSPPRRYIADPAAFLYSLTNSLGRPEKLESKGTGRDLYYDLSLSATFGSGCDLYISDNADCETRSYTCPGSAYKTPASAKGHPMAQGKQTGWRTSEVVAWEV